MAGDSKVIRHEACPKCRAEGKDNSGDNLAIYDDGHAYCFAYHGLINYKTGERIITTKINDWIPVTGTVEDIMDRGLNEETCRKFNYQVKQTTQGPVHIANYYTVNNELVGQKIRLTYEKKFVCRGNLTNPPLFGQQLWAYGGKRLVVTEGEIDCLSVSQIQDNKWPVVSIPHGAAHAVQAFKMHLEYLNSFETVVICFDNDEAGSLAARACAKILRPGIAKIATLSRKDANEYLSDNDGSSLVNCLWQATAYHPDGIMHVQDVPLTERQAETYEYPWTGMTTRLFGRMDGELVMHASGSGVGKSTVIRSMVRHDLDQGERVGCLMLEESCRKTIHELMSLYLHKPLNKIFASRSLNKMRKQRGHDEIEFDVMDTLTDEEYEKAKEIIRGKHLYLYDHFGSLDCDSLIQKLDYMVTGLGCTRIYLDHISIIVSGMETGNERKDIDILMTRLRQFVERTGCHVDSICHLTKPKSTPFEEGGQISLRDFRGSGALYQLADSCLGYERNQQNSNKDIANTLVVRSLKDRRTGVTGVVAALRFNSDDNLLYEIDFTFDEHNEVIFEPSSPSSFNYSSIFEETSYADTISD